METLTKIAWALLALLHIIPVLPAFNPSLVERLYGVSPDGDVGILLVHRAALFGVVLVATGVAAFHADSRRLASILAAISIVSFLVIYVRAGAPTGDLRKIAAADALGLIPLIFVLWRAWR